MTTRLRVLIAVLALVFLAAHLVALPRTLEDIDSINFALGVEHFDVRAHRPHPPGYPVFIAMAKASTAVVGAVRPAYDRDRRAAVGLAVLAVLAGALGAWVAAEFWMALGLSALSAWLAALLMLAAPLYWLTAARPMTDMLGLVAALAVQTLLLRGMRRIDEPGLPRDWIRGAAAAGFIIGIRSQTVWLTGPLIVWALAMLASRRRVAQALALIGAAAAGAVAWAVPLVWKSGGVQSYLGALGSQGAEDFTNIEMLWTSPTWRLFTVSMHRTFIDAWQDRTFAHVVLVLAIAGLVRLLRRDRRAAAVVVSAFLPYLAFHLAFQETVTIRYGLPLVVPVAGLAAFALSGLGRYAALAGTAALAIAGVVFTQPRLEAYSAGAPLFLAMQDMAAARGAEPAPPLLRMHHQVWWGVQRLFEWYRPVWDVGPQPFPGDREWLGVVDHFRGGDARPVWFMGDVSRTDLAAFDPRTTVAERRYLFPDSLRTLIGGRRLDSLIWWRIGRPGWMLGRGWALTPELAGMNDRDLRDDAARTATAYLLRRPDAVQMVIGGRYLGPDGGPGDQVTVRLDGRALDGWRVGANPRNFLRWIEMPAGAIAGEGYATLTVDAVRDGGGTASPIGLEQFDAAPVSDTIYALADGWYEPEEDPATGRQWRWSSAKSVIDVHGPPRARTLRFSAESPLKYFDRPPTVAVRAGGRTLVTLAPSGDFTETVAIPADAVASPVGTISIELDRTYEPREHGSPDPRHLGLRIFSLTLE